MNIQKSIQFILLGLFVWSGAVTAAHGLPAICTSRSTQSARRCLRIISPGSAKVLIVAGIGLGLAAAFDLVEHKFTSIGVGMVALGFAAWLADIADLHQRIDAANRLDPDGRYRDPRTGRVLDGDSSEGDSD